MELEPFSLSQVFGVYYKKMSDSGQSRPSFILQYNGTARCELTFPELVCFLRSIGPEFTAGLVHSSRDRKHWTLCCDVFSNRFRPANFHDDPANAEKPCGGMPECPPDICHPSSHVPSSECADHICQCAGHLPECADHIWQCDDHVSEAADHISEGADHISEGADHICECADHVSEGADHISDDADDISSDSDDLPEDIADALESMGLAPRKKPWYATVAPTFKVYIRLNKEKTEAKFMVVACGRTPATNYVWAPPTKVSGRTWRYSIDCTPGVDDYSMKPNYIVGYQTIRRLGQWFMSKHLMDPMQRDWFWHSCLCDTARIKHENQLQNTENLTQFITKCLPGCKVVRGSTPKDKPETAFTYEKDGVERDIVSITWICSWAIDAWNKANYIQLDCSFQGAWPFVYCVPQAIIRNEAVPLGFIITPSECSTTYDWFCVDLANSDPTKKVKLKEQIILSDEGSGLKRFCRKSPFGKALLHFYCHRHLIQAFGASGLLGQLVKQALATQSKTIYSALRPQLLRTAWRARRDKKITRKAYNLFCKFCSARFPHGIWHRAVFGVARCSNHAERFHGVINRRIKGCRQLSRKLYQIYLYIMEKRKHYGDFSQLRRNLDRLRACGEAGSKECDLAECVAFRANMALRFGLEYFPCRHTVEKWPAYIRKYPVPPLPALASWDFGPVVPVFLEHDLTAVQKSARGSRRFKRRIKWAIRPREDARDDDEANPRPVEKVRWTAEDFDGYFTARRVVMGAKALIDKRRREEGDIVCLSFWILTGWNTGLSALIQQGRTDAEQQDWVAGFTIMWWEWAAKGNLHSRPGDFPIDNLPAAHLAPSDDEAIPGDEDLPGLEIVLGDDDLPSEGDLPNEDKLYEFIDVPDATGPPPRADVNSGAATGQSSDPESRDDGTWARKLLSRNPILECRAEEIGEHFVAGTGSASESDDELLDDNDGIDLPPPCLSPDGAAVVEEIAHEPDGSITQCNAADRRNPRRETRCSGSRESPSDRPTNPNARPYTPRGFNNFGQTCFVNAPLQALFCVRPFREFLSSRKVQRFLKKPCRAPRRGRPAPPSRDAAISCRALLCCKKGKACVSDLRDLPGLVPSSGGISFTAPGPQDAADFLRSLLEQLDKDLGSIIVERGQPRFNPFLRPAEALRDDGGKGIIANLFAGEYVERTVCVHGHSSNSPAAFVTLSLSCPELTMAIDLIDLVRAFFCPAELDDSNLYLCSMCDCYVRARRSFRISLAPPVLIFHICRMDYHQVPMATGSGQRTSTAVRVPEVLTMGSDLVASQIDTVTYRLLFCVDHSGNLDGGHFIAHVRSDSTWHTCDDLKVKSDTHLPYGGFPTSMVYLVGYELSKED
jgi:ubiquitin C-terminal hydrolase